MHTGTKHYVDLVQKSNYLVIWIFTQKIEHFSHYQFKKNNLEKSQKFYFAPVWGVLFILNFSWTAQDLLEKFSRTAEKTKQIFIMHETDNFIFVENF